MLEDGFGDNWSIFGFYRLDLCGPKMIPKTVRIPECIWKSWAKPPSVLGKDDPNIWPSKTPPNRVFEDDFGDNWSISMDFAAAWARVGCAQLSTSRAEGLGETLTIIHHGLASKSLIRRWKALDLRFSTPCRWPSKSVAFTNGTGA